jgi:hypothetical protein
MAPLSPRGRGLGERGTVESNAKLTLTASLPLSLTLSREGRGDKTAEPPSIAKNTV